MTHIAPLRTIVLAGSGVRLALCAALIARHCVSEATKIIVLNCADADIVDADMILRPDMQRLHNDLQIQANALQSRAKARAVYAVDCAYDGGRIALPFGDYGMARDGAAFHHHWGKGKGLGQPYDLDQYSPSLAIHHGKAQLPLAIAAQIGIGFGLQVDRAGYAQLLLAKARDLGAKIVSAAQVTVRKGSADYPYSITMDGAQFEADFFIDVSPSGQWAGSIGLAETGWQDHSLYLPYSDQPQGIEASHLYSAIQRFIDMLPTRGGGTAERREYNRLSLEQSERIADMVCLLGNDDKSISQRPALRRKIEVFQTCGRIPVEDYEVFSPAEWLTILLAKCGNPLHHDRLADRLSEQDLLIWLDQLRGKIGQLKRQLESI